MGDERTRQSYDAVAAEYALHLSDELSYKPLDSLPVAAAELHRVVEPGGAVLVAFHVGEEVRHVTDWWGHGVDLDFCFFETERVAAHLDSAGLAVEAVVERAPYLEEVATRRAYLLARRPSDR